MSQKYSLNAIDWKKIGIGAGVAVGGALATYAAQVFGSIDFGVYTPVAVAIFGILLNAARKFLQGESEQIS